MTDFNSKVSGWEKKTGGAVDKIMQSLAIEALTRVVLKSPVDTGRFRGNWNVAIGGADYATTETTDKSGVKTISRGHAVAKQINKETNNIFVTNSLPYARMLEYGHSKQAPGGMVRLTVEELRPIINKIVEMAGAEYGK